MVDIWRARLTPVWRKGPFRKLAVALGIPLLLGGFFLIFHPSTTVSSVVRHREYLAPTSEPGIPAEQIRLLRAVLCVGVPLPALEPEQATITQLLEAVVGSSAQLQVEVQPDGPGERWCLIRLTDPGGTELLGEVVTERFEFDFRADTKGYYELEANFAEGSLWHDYGVSLENYYTVETALPQSVVLWQSPFGPLGILSAVLGGLFASWGLPRAVRFRLLGPFLVLCSVGFAFGFSFNWFYDWYCSTGAWTYGKEHPSPPYAVGVACCCAVAGGLITGRSFTFDDRRRAVVLASVLWLFLAVLAFVTVPGGYYLYRDPTTEPYPYYYALSGDYLAEAFLLRLIQFCLVSAAFGAFLAGLLTKRRPSLGKGQ